MKKYRISETLSGKCQGAGPALAAIARGQVVDLVYLREVLPDFDGHLTTAVMDNDRLAPTAWRMSALGSVSIGTVSGAEFVECEA